MDHFNIHPGDIVVVSAVGSKGLLFRRQISLPSRKDCIDWAIQSAAERDKKLVEVQLFNKTRGTFAAYMPCGKRKRND